MGRSLARLFVERGDWLTVLGRDEEELKRSVADLQARGGARVAYAVCDLEMPETFASAISESPLPPTVSSASRRFAAPPSAIMWASPNTLTASAR